VVADVECIDRVQVNQLFVVADVGEVVSRDGVLHQLEGGAIQSLSWTLQESAPIALGAVSANGWADYPMARFTDVPSVKTEVIDRPGEPFLGAGEAAAGPTGAAIVNAVTSALGVRLTELPLTPAAITRALR
jgi:CO/xanthine dehydrogenase Mo-binding subunit